MDYLVTDHVTKDHVLSTGRLDEEVVDEEYVRCYTDLEARRFFINLGGHEQMRKNKDGTIVCKSTSPDGKEVRVVRFTPVSRNGDS